MRTDSVTEILIMDRRQLVFYDPSLAQDVF